MFVFRSFALLFLRLAVGVLLAGTASGWLAATCAGQTASQSAAAPAAWVRIPRVARAPKLEDFLNGTPREAETSVSEFRQREPGDGVNISQETRAYLSYDDHNLYVIFVCKDEPEKVRGRLSKREDILADDAVLVALDTFHDKQRAYMFAVNPLGIQLDGITTEGQGDDYSFDTLWRSEGRLTAEGYVVWMAIPFKSLRFPNAATQTWGIALGRSIVRNNEMAFWPYITRRVEGFVQQMATLEGLEQISPGRNLQFIPYGIFTRARLLDATVPKFRTENDARGGLDAKMVLRDAFTLDVALNPDFSQVESDEPQVLVNQRFEVYFPEKRPFFIENAGFFQTPMNLFFSRRIGDPQFGVRLTGKAGHWTIGGLAIDDRAPGKLAPSSSPLHDKRAGIGAVRVRREFSKQGYIGGLVTSRDFGATSNRVFSVDTRFKLNPNWVLEGQVMRSYTRQADGSRLVGPAYWAELMHIGRHFYYGGHYNDRSPDFRSEVGYIPRVDIRQTQQFASYYWRPERSRLLRFGPSATTLVNWNRAGKVQDWMTTLEFEAEFTGETYLGFSRTEAMELFQNIEFRKHTTSFTFDTSWLKKLSLSASYAQGSRPNYFPASGPAFLADFSSATAGFTYRPMPKFRFEQTYIYARLGTREGSTPSGFAAGTAIFNNHILRSKVNYQFTRELSLRAILDYNAVLPNAQLLPLERAKQLSADFLLTYLVHPGTALYIGYTDRYENLNIAPTPTPTLVRTGSPDTSTGRQFFIKLSYLFRY
jgi:hypothetical protein